MRRVEVSPYNEKWITQYRAEAQKLSDIFGQLLIDIHHIGSTSVRGLEAKPIIDIMPVVRDTILVDEYNHAMEAIGYEPKGENGITGRRFFQKGSDKRTHHVHIFEVGSPEIERHLVFRDYLRSHTEAVNEYGQLKQKLAQQFPYDIESYIRGKESLVLDIERRAMGWNQSSNENKK